MFWRRGNLDSWEVTVTLENNLYILMWIKYVRFWLLFSHSMVFIVLSHKVNILTRQPNLTVVIFSHFNRDHHRKKQSLKWRQYISWFYYATPYFFLPLSLKQKNVIKSLKIIWDYILWGGRWKIKYGHMAYSFFWDVDPLESGLFLMTWLTNRRW